jgi:hypothetical protein
LLALLSLVLSVCSSALLQIRQCSTYLQLHDNHGSDHVPHVFLGKFSVTISEDDIQALSNTGSTTSLVLTSMRDAVHVFINGKLAGSAMGWNVRVDQKISLQAGSNSIALLSMTVGLQVCSCLLLITDTLPV